MKNIIDIYERAGVFAENKDIARSLRMKQLTPALKRQEEVVLDFANVEGVTQSFIHALISQPIRDFGSEVIDHIIFKDCNSRVQRIIGIVVDYMQES